MEKIDAPIICVIDDVETKYESRSAMYAREIIRAHSALLMFTKMDEGAIYHGINLVYNLKNNKNCSDEFRAEYAKKYGKEPNLFDGD